ncbi:hypothetical protein EON65_20045 [archaeon]|nr:MAG: hypothetical protein EON65_20045 [archaeon]
MQETKKPIAAFREELEGDFFSRKLAMSSMTRHMASWKTRRFSLIKRQGELTLGSKKGNSYVYNTICLLSPFVHMGIHSYCPGRKHVIYIKYPDAELDTPQELLIDFGEEAMLKAWHEVRIVKLGVMRWNANILFFL